MIEVDHTGPKVKLPEPATTFGKIDNGLRSHAGVTRDRIVRTSRRQISHRTGRTAADTVGVVRRTSRGFRVGLENRKSAHILRFLDGGTGSKRPGGKRIAKNRRGVLPGGIRPSGRGQRPQRTISKIFFAINTQVMPWALDTMEAEWRKAVDAIRGSR